MYVVTFQFISYVYGNSVLVRGSGGKNFVNKKEYDEKM
jgi:hypothetical protein